MVTLTVLAVEVIGVRIDLIDEVIEVVHVLHVLIAEHRIFDDVHDVIVRLKELRIGIVQIFGIDVLEVVEGAEENVGFGLVHEYSILQMGGRWGFW